MKKFRKPYYSLVIAVFFLFFSCEKYDTVNNIAKEKFTYEIFNDFKKDQRFKTSIEKIVERIQLNQNLKSFQDKSDVIMEVINEDLDSEVVLPDEVKPLLLMDSEEILHEALEKNYMNEEQVSLIDNFSSKIETNMGLNTAISSLEIQVFESNLSNKDIIEMNNFVNVIRTIDYYNPNVFKIDKANLNKSNANPWRCALAIIAFIVAFVGLVTCIAVWPCLIAYTLFVNATLAIGDQCLS